MSCVVFPNGNDTIIVPSAWFVITTRFGHKGGAIHPWIQAVSDTADRNLVCHSVAPQIPIGRVTDCLDPWMNSTPFMTESGSNYEPSTGHYDRIVAVREYNTAHV